MHIDVFEKIAKQVAELKKTGMGFDVIIENDQYWVKGCSLANFSPQFYSVTTLAQLSALQQTLGASIYTGVDVYNPNNPKTSVKIEGFDPTPCVTDLAAAIKTEKDYLTLRKDFKSLKFFSPNVKSFTGIAPTLISDEPAMRVEDGITYRYIGKYDYCELCVPHDNPLYVYLDKGFTYLKLTSPKERDKVVITNEMNPDTYLVMLACSLNRKFTKFLENECFINFNKAKLLRVRVEKELTGQEKATYDRVKDIVLKDYEKMVNSNMLVKVQRNELPHATFNQIKITKDSATYDTVNLTAPGMLDFLVDYMVFDDNTDIYTIIGSYIRGKLAELEGEKLPSVEVELDEEGVAKPLKDSVIEKKFKINGINISVKRTSANTRRTVNNYAINIEEIEAVCYRASCFNTQAIFNKFVASVNEMSLKWHDAIGSGIPVKIHDGLTAAEYGKPEGPISCPRIRFLKEEDGIYLVTGEGKDDKAKVKLNAAIKGLNALNRKTTNKYVVGDGYTPRNAAWARRKIGEVLKDCCTFDVKTPMLDAEGSQMVDQETKKKLYNVDKVCTLTDEAASFIGKMAQEYYNKAVERSKLLLAQAIKATGATSIQFAGEDCWYVEGGLHKYAVSKATNRVFNFEKGNSICIVEPGHRVEIGFDATVARLMALKNDSVTVAQVGTLRQG